MHAAEAIISTEGCLNHIQPYASEGFAFKEARVLVAAKNSAKLFFFPGTGELTQHVLHRNIQHFINRWKREGLIHAFYLSLMALISFFISFQNQNNNNWKHMAWWNKTGMTRSAPSPQRSIHFSVPFCLFIKSVSTVCDWGLEKQVIFTKIWQH